MKRPPVDLSNVHKVLIVRPTALGDVSRTVPALVSLRAALPEATIDWVVHESFADVVRHHPALNEVILFPRQRFGRMWFDPSAARQAWRWARNLRHRQYDLAVDLQGLSRSGVITWLTRAPIRLGFANAREGAWLAYTHRYPIDEHLHTVTRTRRLLESAGVPTTDDMTLYVGHDDQRWLNKLLGHPRDQPFATLAPTARWLCKCWPIDRYIEIARRLLDSGKVGRRLIVLAAPGEHAQVQPLVEAFSQGTILVPQTSVGQMMAVLERTKLLICNDSAALHIAVGLSRPLVAIFGPTDPALVGPYQRDDAVVLAPGSPRNAVVYRRQRDDQTLIAQVTVDEVWQKALTQLAP